MKKGNLKSGFFITLYVLIYLLVVFYSVVAIKGLQGMNGYVIDLSFDMFKIDALFLLITLILVSIFSYVETIGKQNRLEVIKNYLNISVVIHLIINFLFIIDPKRYEGCGVLQSDVIILFGVISLILLRYINKKGSKNLLNLNILYFGVSLFALSYFFTNLLTHLINRAC